MTEITGTSGGDELVGTSGDDVISGLGGGDIIIGLEGDDTLIGGDGGDLFLGGEGTDSYDGGTGRDALYYRYVNGFDSDRFTHDLVIDVLAGTASFAGITETFTSIERFFLGDGSDIFYGSSEDEDVNGYAGNDTLYGEGGNDELWGGFGNDTLYGGDGDDFLSGQYGQDLIYGGAGNDTIMLGTQESAGPDTVDGGFGFDTLQVRSSVFEYPTTFAGSTITGIESIEGYFEEVSNPTPDTETSVRVQFDASFFQNNDIVSVVSNAHDIDNWHFAITVVMSDETTLDLSGLQFDANWNDFTPNGEVGDSITIIGGASDETIIGSAVNDIIDAGSGDNIIRGGGGDDLLTGGIEMDRFEFFHGDGNDTITNFDPVWDLIILRGFSQAEIDTAYSERLIDGNDIVLSFSDGDSIRLQNVNPEDFSKNQLVGAPAEPDIPGDTSTEAWIVPGETFTSEIESAYDSDWLRFSVGADEYFAIEISAEGNLDTTIRDASGNVLNLSSSRVQTIFDSVTGNQVLLLKNLPEGDYILDVSAYHAPAYTITTRILEDDFSADTSTTGRIALGETLESTFAFEGDRDWIGFDGVEGQVLRFSMNALSSVIDGYGIALYDSSGNMVELPHFTDQYVTTNPATGEQYFTFEVPSTGEYFLRLYGSFSDPGIDAAYTVSMSELDDIPADASTTAILTEPGETLLGELETPGDSDWIAIDVAGPQTLRFMATGDNDDLYTASLTLSFYDEAGNLIGTGRPEYDDSFDQIGNGLLHADHAGRYYVAVEAGTDNIGFYSLTAMPLDYGTPVPTSDGTSVHAGGGIYGSISTSGLPDGLVAAALILSGDNGNLELSVGIIDPVADQQLSSVILGVDGANVAAAGLQGFDGGFAAAYIVADYETATSTLMLALFDESGALTGEPITLGGVTGTHSGLTDELGIVRNADGSIGITAGIITPDGAQLYLLDVASSGTVQAVTLVASLDGASVSDPTLVLLETGERLITWIESSETSGLTQHTNFIDAAGSANPGVRAGPDLSFSDYDAVVTAVEGGFAILRSVGTHYELQLFDLDGNVHGGPVSIGTTGGTSGTYDFDVLGMADGTIVTATTGPDGVEINRFDGDGTLLGETTQEYSNWWNIPRNVHLAALSDTSFSLLFGGGAGYQFAVNTFDLPPIMTRLDGGEGAEHLDGSGLADFIRGFAGDDYLNGLYGDDDLFGGAGNDHILGGDGLDRLIAGDGSDKLLGGKGADTFVLTADGIADTISDFDFREDHIEIVRADGLQSLSDLTITQDGQDVVITGQGLEVRLYDTSAEALHAGHFVFVGDYGDGFLALPDASAPAAEVESLQKPDVSVALFPEDLPEPPQNQNDWQGIAPLDYGLDAQGYWTISPGDDPGDPGWFLG
jgi:Ca2+-binding RTX toxin-like protein